MSNIFISSFIFAIWSVILFFEKKVGLSAFLFVAPFTYYIIYLLDKKDKIKNERAKILFIPITLLSLTYFLYDNSLKELNLIAILFLMVSMFILLFNEEFTIFKVVEKMIDILLLPIFEYSRNIKESITKFCKITKKNTTEEQNEKIKSIVKAIFYTIPLCFIILCLLISADTSFSNLFGNLFEMIFKIFRKFKFDDIIVRIILIFITDIYLLGCLKNILNSKDDGKVASLENNIKKETLTIKMVLGTLNFIYLIFSIVQIKEFCDFNSNLNYADFARKGFFQLMIVSIINLITILVAKNNENKDEKNLYLKSMNLTMIFFTFTLIISAAFRMNLYENAYGYTHLRFLVYFSLFTEAVLLIPTILYVIDKKINLIKVYFTIITIMYVILNFINMDKFIAKKNIDRYFETGKIDFNYLKYNTGMDAVPEIIRLIDIDDSLTRKLARGYIKTLDNELSEEKLDIFELNFSRFKAQKIINEKYKGN